MNKYFKELQETEEVSKEVKQNALFFLEETSDLTREELEVIAAGMYASLDENSQFHAREMIKLYEH